MQTNSVNNNTSQASGSQSASDAAAKSAEARETETAVQARGKDTYGPSIREERDAGIYTIDTGTVDRMKAELEDNKLRFLETVKRVLGNQLQYGQGAWKNISPEDQAAAQQAISEDGYWGVKNTSERIVAFAKALVGGDPSRVEDMRDAFIKGYEAAGGAWGSALPDISQKTYDAVMKLFDEWADSAGKEEEAGGESAESAAAE